MVFCICSLEKIPLWGFFFCGNIYVKTLNIFKSGKAHVDDPVPACGGPAPPHTPRSLFVFTGLPTKSQTCHAESSSSAHNDDDSIQARSHKLFFHEGYFTQITNA